MTPNSPSAFNILALSGGGCFCHGQAVVLSKCAKLIPRFHAICGTSGGAINGLAAARGGMTLVELEDFYRRYARVIFKGYRWRRHVPQFARYPDREFNAILMRHIPGAFGDIGIPMFAVSHNLHSGRPKVWYSGDEDDAGMDAWQVARASAAAHSYFKPWHGFADGGVYANDPVMCGAAGAVARLGALPGNIRIFSIGSGTDSRSNRTRLPWTKLGWAALLLRDTLTSTDIARFQARQYHLGAYEHHAMGDQQGMDMDDPRVVDMIDLDWRPQMSAAINAMHAFFAV